MDPNNPSTPPPNQNQYDFIMNPQQPKKRGKFSLPTGGNTQRILMMILGGGVLLIILTLVGIALFGGSSVNSELVTVTKKQQEIARVSEIGNKKAGSTRAQTIASMTKSTLTSDQQKTLNYLEKNGTRVSSGDLNELRQASTDQELDTAERNGRFDEAFLQHIERQLNDYASELSTIQNSTNSRTLKELIDQQLANVNLILSL